MEYFLENVSGIGKATAERMKAAGIETVQQLATLKLEDLVNLKIKGIGKATAEKYINNAKKLYRETDQKEIEDTSQEKKLLKVATISKEKKPIKEEISKEVSHIKDLIRKQAECNIGLVGHVDHGMIMSFRHFS